MTKDEIDRLVGQLAHFHKKIIENIDFEPIVITIKDRGSVLQAAQELQSQQVDLEKAKEILKDLGRISVPVESYRLWVVAKRAKKLLKKMAGE